ncbi:OmpA family protein [Mucilaginibacter pedocola]|uniref:OmpA-like domain-containing protein n=1 Tax=Mucilaginibacter pedocola TaxID=1792845 RepID=A0A1S9PCB3_9SPHI|nr:OmpA family protein [Mucilaginibacter pedocola]OOQ58622.1 hypothetical protein BC343_08125 [Mucilaginibacter pedocola]
MRSTLLTLVAVFIFKGVFAQQYREIKNLADKDFDEGKYFEAAYQYEKLADSSKAINLAIPTYVGRNQSPKRAREERPFIYYRLAESYRLYQNYRLAENWYARVIGANYDADYPLTRLWYGLCLRANERFDEAITQLRSFMADYKGDAKYKTIAGRELSAALYAKQQYAATPLTSIDKANIAVNNAGGNYAMVKNNGEVWLTSTAYHQQAKRSLNNIYRQQGDSAVAFVAANSNYADYGTPSLSKNGGRLYLTAWHKANGKTSLAIYYTVKLNNRWAAIKRLNKNVNTDNANAMQPRVTDDGKRLYYASDKPGGFGGTDIWMSDLDDNGDAINSVNLGRQVNSADDEQAPFFDSLKNRLVYSSKGFTGMGGFDLFESYYSGNQWLAPKNLGYPANSSKDDLYYFADPIDAHRAYISSDRQSDCCLAIYELNEQPFVIRINLTACNSGSILHDATVTLIDADTKRVIRTIEQSVNGSYAVSTYDRYNYLLRIEKAGYLAKTLPINSKLTTNTLYSSEICLDGYTVNKPIAIKNILYNYSTATLRPESKIALDTVVAILNENPMLKIELAAHTDSVGTNAANLKLSQLRANACVEYIISKGIDRKRLYAKGYGESKPVAPNSLPNGADNPEGRQLNRRTEFTILGK